MSQSEFAAFVAIDWADQKHFWQLAASQAAPRMQGELLNTPEAIHLWAADLHTRFPDAPLAVALEQSRGSLCYQLAKFPFFVLFPVHPATSAAFRQAFYPSGAKSDPNDTALLLDILLQHRHHLRRLDPDTVETRQLLLFVELRRRLVNERTRQSNRLTAWLKLYFPQTLDWFDDIDSPLGCDFLQRWPTLESLQRARQETIERFFREHNSRSQARIEERLRAIGNAVPAVRDPALLYAGEAATASLVAILKALNSSVAALDNQIAEQWPKHPEAALFQNLPGAGAALVPRLIVAFGTNRNRSQSAAELAAYSGIAPVTRQSGKTKSVHFRRACPQFLRQTFHEFAAHSVRSCLWARQFYEQQRNKGQRHHAVVRELAFKWIRVLYRCWQDRTPYDEQRFLQHLEQRKAAQKPEDEYTTSGGCKGG